MFSVVSGLRDKSAKGYPVKKVKRVSFGDDLTLKLSQLLLLLWKTLLACFGGYRDYARVKKLARELGGLSNSPEAPEGSLLCFPLYTI